MTDDITIDPPAKATLARYGLSIVEWQRMLFEQGGVCAICGQVPSISKSTGKRRMVIDHEHVRGWKKMPPERRKLYVRGLLCWWCNSSYLGRGITIEKAEGMVRFLRAYANRRPQ